MKKFISQEEKLNKMKLIKQSKERKNLYLKNDFMI